MSWLAWAAVAIFVGSYVLIATERVHRFAAALGADLGGNATLVGASASANVVVVGIAARNGLRISFTGWLRYGLPTAALSIAICVPFILLRYT